VLPRLEAGHRYDQGGQDHCAEGSLGAKGNLPSG